MTEFERLKAQKDAIEKPYKALLELTPEEAIMLNEILEQVRGKCQRCSGTGIVQNKYAGSNTVMTEATCPQCKGSGLGKIQIERLIVRPAKLLRTNDW